MKVTLLKNHTHKDVPHKASDEIDVSAVEAKWLADHKVIDSPTKSDGKK
jgi:hypothetical protein